MKLVDFEYCVKISMTIILLITVKSTSHKTPCVYGEHDFLVGWARGRSSQCVFARNWSKLPECAELGWHRGTPEWKSNLFDMAYFIENMPAHKFTWNTGSERIYVRNGVLIEEVHRSCSAQLIFLLCRRLTNTDRSRNDGQTKDGQLVGAHPQSSTGRPRLVLLLRDSGGGGGHILTQNVLLHCHVMLWGVHRMLRLLRPGM